jgi:hypothetical protein
VVVAVITQTELIQFSVLLQQRLVGEQQELQVVLVVKVLRVQQDKAIVVVVVALGLAAVVAVKEVLEHLLLSEVLEGQVV